MAADSGLESGTEVLGSNKDHHPLQNYETSCSSDMLDCTTVQHFMEREQIIVANDMEADQLPDILPSSYHKSLKQLQKANSNILLCAASH